MIYILGGRGRLGSAIGRLYAGRVELLDRSVYDDWWKGDAADQITRSFAMAPSGSAVLVTSGVLDPSSAPAEHERINLQLPIQLIRGACKAGLRVLTFGTVMERLVGHPNAYIGTKAKLGHYVAERAAAGDAVTHLQLHTLYGGGEPAPFMFLGQICRALREGRPFQMSPGRQLREYHHVDDDAAAVHAALAAGITGVAHLSHGKPVALRELASYIFSELRQEELLRIGALPEPQDDNYATVLQRPNWLDEVLFRPTLEGVVEFLKPIVPRQLP